MAIREMGNNFRHDALASAFAEAGYDILAPEDAEQRFSSAVANVYSKRVIGHRAHLHVLRRCGDDGLPDCAAFLAASVLAAYHMQSNDEVSGNAYYRRFADLLRCKMSGAHPVGFNTPVFESLWTFLRNWLHKVHGRQLVTPRADVGLRRFVALPLAHVPLRRLEIEKLPAFFAWAGYEPQSRINPAQLFADLRRWQQSRNALTQTGADALFDDRSEAVLAQVSSELQSWDGSFSDSIGRRSALVEIQFDVVQRQPILAYLPRRPSGFPRIFDDGEHLFEASDEGWYDPTLIRPTDGELLASGFEWRSVVNDTQFTLRRSETLVVALTPSSSYSGLLSSRRLLQGITCSVLCRDEIIDKTVAYLSEVAQQRLNKVNHPQLPEGWSIIRDFAPQMHIEAPTGLETLEIDPNVNLLVSGGLRIGRRWSWLEGAPPRILVSGLGTSGEVKVNGEQVEVDDNGNLMINAILTQPGEYLIEAGRVRRRIEIVSPQMSVHDRLGNDDSHRTVTVSLPQGLWTLIGASPGEVCIAHGPSFVRGTLASCPFRPVWAVQVDAGPGAQAVVLGELEPPRKYELRRLRWPARNRWERWASVIYNANIRRPCFCRVNGTVHSEGIEPIWKQYAATAKQIKRALKRR